MSNFFNYLKKIFPKNKTEKKAKEEEDIHTDLNLNIEKSFARLTYVKTRRKIHSSEFD